jgi:hypothetical protein
MVFKPCLFNEVILLFKLSEGFAILSKDAKEMKVCAKHWRSEGRGLKNYGGGGLSNPSRMKTMANRLYEVNAAKLSSITNYYIYICTFYSSIVYPRISDDESFISAEEAKELLKQPGWVFQKNNE